eukprot:CAMPEP_0172462878 /NCGR_PEP_ID=MMETSP1065-20121228/45333_1 /TAXON_ID=265537 /ORGANISM="Amphiprora paludosa, Strain CCMP125" /LENGTH=369 /DNA_ID=CAMNT_0013218671 /DNA_START=211 /DNA_END=1320 /DNA_ORIENTATION=-
MANGELRTPIESYYIFFKTPSSDVTSSNDSLEWDLFQMFVRCYYETKMETQEPDQELLQKDAKKYQHLHMACSNRNISVQHLEYILKFEPNAAKEADWNIPEEYPLHKALASELPNPDVVGFLVELYPDAVKGRDDRGHLTIMERLSFLNHLDVFQKICTIEPDLLQQIGPSGSILTRLCVHDINNSPLYPKYDERIYQWVLEQNPSLASVPMPGPLLESRLPHHFIKSLGAAKHLVRVFPQGLSQPDAEHYLPLHRVVSASGDVACVKFVASKYPPALLHRNDFGETPLDILQDRAAGRLINREDTGKLVQLLSGIRDDLLREKQQPQSTVSDNDQWAALAAQVHKLQEENERLQQRVQALEDATTAS